jgi:formate hydrogenlyase subunit 4
VSATVLVLAGHHAAAGLGASGLAARGLAAAGLGASGLPARGLAAAGLGASGMAAGGRAVGGPAVAGWVATLVQVIVVGVGAPLLVGLMKQVRSRLEGRVGAGIGQPWRDLRKLTRRPSATPDGTGWPFRLAPLVLAGTSMVVVAIVPLISTGLALDGYADLFAVVGLLALGTVTLALAALDTGTAFGGMGASRAVTILALVEPTVMVAVFALSIRAGTTNLAGIIGATLAHPVGAASAASALAAVALLLVIVAETGRIPVDNPSTHLELTMIHEAMVLEYAGMDLALIEFASAARMAALLGLFGSLFLPWGIGSGAPSVLGIVVAITVLAVKTGLLGAALAGVEVVLAKLRLFRVPELLAGSLVLALLAVVLSAPEWRL